MPGDQAIVSPSEVRQFAGDLTRFNEKLKANGSRHRRRSTWPAWPRLSPRCNAK